MTTKTLCYVYQSRLQWLADASQSYRDRLELLAGSIAVRWEFSGDSLRLPGSPAMVRVVVRSGNRKTGPVGGTIRPLGLTCPHTCPLLPNTYRQSVRPVLDRRYIRAKLSFSRRYPHIPAWGYTHAADLWTDAGYGPESWPANFTTLASCHTRKQARRYQRAGWRTARVAELGDIDPAKDGNETVCPNDRQKAKGHPNPLNCAQCQLCWPGDNKPNIVFLAK